LDKKSDSDKNNIRNLKIQFNKDEKMKKDILIKKKNEKEIIKKEREEKERLLKDKKRYILFIYMMYIYIHVCLYCHMYIYIHVYIFMHICINICIFRSFSLSSLSGLSMRRMSILHV
jgi:hypothetical protein